MQRPPFKEVEASRPPFEQIEYKATKTIDPDWKVGQGSNDTTRHYRSNEFSAERNKLVYRSEELTGPENYKMLINGVVPRPIAFLSTQDSKVVRNLAPFSYFNVASHNPPTIMISINSKANGHKDSASNILETKRFTVNLISEPFIEAANYTCIDAPPEVDEWALSGLTPLPSNYWEKDGGGPPRVGESPFSLECELYNHMPITDDNGKQTGTIVLGRVRNYVLNEGIRQEDGSIDPRGLLPISRGGGITYFRTLQGFELPRPVWKDEQDNHDIKTVLEEASKKKTT